MSSGVRLPERARHVVVVAGEPSGDAHAADFVEALSALTPSVRFSGMGSSHMRQAGVELIVDSTKLAVVGLVEVLGKYGEIRTALSKMKSHLAAAKPDLLVLVDYVEFNLRLARAAKKMGIKVLFYVSPQVWAWRPKRIKRIGESIDAIAVLFPFEEALYRRHGIPVRYVGNPLVDQVPRPRAASELRRELGLAEERPLVGLFPGSRSGEIRRHLPVMIKACEQLGSRMPDLQLAMAVAGSIDTPTEITPLIPKNLDVKLISGKSHDVMAASDALMISSGTATLEAGLLGVPMAIMYRVAPVTYAILKRFILIPDIGLVNIVAGERVVQEFVQAQATPAAISAEIEKLLTNRVYAGQVRAKLQGVREKLGAGGVSERVAAMAQELMDTGRIA